MAVRPGKHIARPRAPVESITIPLIPAAADDLQRLQERTNLSKTDLANRAITSYEFFDAQLQSGHDLIVRDRKTGRTQLVRFLLRPCRTSETCRPRRGAGPAGGQAAHHRQDFLPLAGHKARK